MMMYDSLNQVSQYTSAQSGTQREKSITSNEYWYIKVAQYTPKLTVEVTIEQKERNEFLIKLTREGGTSGEPEMVETFVNAIGGDRGFNGTETPSTVQSYTFVFDYEAHGLYDGAGYHYGVYIKDLNADDGKDTTVTKIVWRDQTGSIIETKDLDSDENEQEYSTTLGKVELNKTTQDIQKGDADTLQATVFPSDPSCTLTWESSNDNCVTVNNGVVTAVGLGNATVTVTGRTTNGREFTATCEYTVLEGYGDSKDDATTVNINTPMNGVIAKSGDVSWFKFNPTADDRYLIYATGSSNIRAELYLENSDAIYASGNVDGVNKIVALSKVLREETTYYIKLYGNEGNCGRYTFYVTKGSVQSLILTNYNPDARHIQVLATASSLYDTLELTIGTQKLTFAKNTTSVIIDPDTLIRYKVTVHNYNAILQTEWVIDIDISEIDSLIGCEKVLTVLLKNGDLSLGSGGKSATFTAYKTSFISGVNISANNSLQLLLNGLQETGYSLSAYSATESLITVTSTTKAATGMKIVKKGSNTNKIVEVYHVVVLGDAQGDGYVDNMDSAYILSYDAGTGTITAIQAIGADANQDGMVDNLDSALILKYDAGIIEGIDQALEMTEVPDGIYFGEPVSF